MGARYNRSVRRAGAFEIAEEIGRGGAGTVWRAIHAPSGLPAAVKTVSPGAHTALAREIRSVAALDHPNIVAIYDQGDGELPWLAMALAEGSLASLRGAHEILDDILRMSLAGLAHAHAAGLVHCDIKPQNLLVAQSSGRVQIWLADFGIARLMDSPSGRLAGTPAYMAPEQLPGASAPVGPPADLYALGCLVYFLLGGRPPFSHADPQQLANAHRHSPPPPLPASAPPGLARWVSICMRKDPLSRFQSAADALYALSDARQRPSVAVTLPDPLPGVQPTIEPAGTLSYGTLGALDLPEIPAEGPLEEELPPIAPPPARPRAPLRRVWLGQEIAAGLGLFGLRHPPLVGRSAEQLAAWERLIERGSPSVLAITGPPGIGRTALLRWLSRSAAESGAATVVRGDSLPALLAAATGHASLPVSARAAWLRRLAPRDPDDVALTLDPPEGAALTALVARWLSRRSSRLRLLAATDALDPALASLASMILDDPSADVLLAAVVPHPSEDPDAAARWAELGGRAGFYQLTLGPLDEPHMLELVRDSLHVSADLGVQIVAVSGGNPGTAMRSVAHASCSGQLEPGPDGLVAAPGSSPLADLGARADLLGTAEQILLEPLAVLGRGRSREEWRALCPPGAPVDSLADKLLRAGLVAESESGIDVSDPELLARAEESARRSGRWRSLHALALQAAPPADPVALARHELHAGRPEAALVRLAAHVRGALRLSWPLIALAEEVSRQLPEQSPLREEALLMKARLHLSRRRHPEALSAAREASASASLEVCAQANALAAAAASRADPASARAHGEAALSAWEALGDVASADEVRITLAEIDLARGQVDAALALHEVVARTSGVARLRAASLRAAAMQRSGGPAIEAMREALDAASAHGDLFHVAALENNLADLLRAASREDEAIEHYVRSSQLFRRTGSPDEVVPRLNLALLAVKTDPALAASESAVLATRLAGQGRKKLLGACRIVEMAALASLGSLDEATARAREGALLVAQTGLVSPDIDAMVRIALRAEREAGRAEIASLFPSLR